MIKVIKNIGLLNICCACHSQENTKTIEFSCGTGGNNIICLCDNCRQELCNVLIKDIEEA